jgi:hypothetical protein
MRLYLHFSKLNSAMNASSWRGTSLNTGDNLLYLYFSVSGDDSRKDRVLLHCLVALIVFPFCFRLDKEKFELINVSTCTIAICKSTSLNS